MDHVSPRTFKATRCTRCGIVIGFGDRCDWCQHRPTGHVDAPGTYQGRHHSEWIGTVRVLVDEDDVDALRTLLPRLAAAAASEANATGQPRSSWVDDQLEQLERRQFGAPSRSDARGTDAA
ncbi:MAG: hypothetical protein ACKOA9_05200 [Actinomycetota bacterium]